MIAYLRGLLAEKEMTRVVVEAGGVGYELFIPISTFDRLPREGEKVKLLAWHCVREDDEILFGFATEEEKAMFLKLTAVSGVGPKIALAVISGCSIGELSLAIASGNAKRIAAIKGVGKKTAEKIIVELKDKVNAIEALAGSLRGKGGESAATAAFVKDAVLALSALGFGDEKASSMVTKVLAEHPEISDTEAVVRLALSER